jgi:hypothetical protein
MKKCCFAAVCAVLAVAVLGAQEGGGVSFSTDYVVKNYAGVRIENGRLRGRVLDYTDDISFDDEGLFGNLDGDEVINKPHELIAATAVLNIKEVAHADALKVYAEIAIEGSVNSFLGVTGTTHGQVLERLKAKYHFSNTEISAAIHDVIDPVVDKYYSQRGMYDITPSVVYTEWKQNGVSRGLDGLQIVKDKLAAFYLSPTPENFAALRGIFASYRETEEKYGDPLAYEAGNSFSRTLDELSDPLWNAVIHDSRSASTAIVAAGSAGRDLGIFSLRYTTRQR